MYVYFNLNLIITIVYHFVVDSDHLIEQRRNSSSSVYHFLLLPMVNIDNLWLEGMNFNKSTTSMKPFSIIRNLLHLNLIYIFIPPTIMSSENSQLPEVLALHIKYLLDNVLIQTNHLMVSEITLSYICNNNFRLK